MALSWLQIEFMRVEGRTAAVVVSMLRAVATVAKGIFSREGTMFWMPGSALDQVSRNWAWLQFRLCTHIAKPGTTSFCEMCTRQSVRHPAGVHTWPSCRCHAYNMQKPLSASQTHHTMLNSKVQGRNSRDTTLQVLCFHSAVLAHEQLALLLKITFRDRD